MEGKVQVYTGNGKGKTTAAFGLAIRAVGAGKKVFFGQFVKGKTYSEIEAIQQYVHQITIKQYGRGCFIYKDPTQEDIEAAQIGLQEMANILSAGTYDLVVMDEACIALYFKLFDVELLLMAIKNRAKHTEVVVTGRYAPEELIAMADLVTEMKEVKHYYNQGLEARKGIEY